MSEPKKNPSVPRKRMNMIPAPQALKAPKKPLLIPADALEISTFVPSLPRLSKDPVPPSILTSKKSKLSPSRMELPKIPMGDITPNNIKTPKFFTFSYDMKVQNLIKKIEKILSFPIVVKPLNEGSSVNVYICEKKNINKILKGLKNYKKIMIEEFIGGREIQVAIMGNTKLGAIELKPKRKFYDYKAKYNSGAKTEHIIPVDLPKKKLSQIMNMALNAHKVIGCKGVTRSDFKYYKGTFFLLEINTQPGMTKLSLVPEIAEHKGINFLKLIEWILKDASTKR